MKFFENNSKNIIFLFLIFFGLLIYSRSPCLFYDGRRNIGELEIFYNYALRNNTFETLFFVYSEAQYFELWVNITSFFTAKLSLNIFLSTVYFSLIVKFYLLIYIFYSNSDFLKSNLHKFIFASFVIYSSGITSEVWLTALHSKSFFGILSFTMIFQNFSKFNKIKFYIYRFAIVFNGLCSIYSSIVAPIYFIKFLQKKNKLNFFNFLYSFLPLIINAFILFYYFFLNNLNKINRFEFVLSKLENALYNNIVRPIFGGNISKFLYDLLNLLNFKIIALIFLGLFACVFLLYLLRKKDNNLNLITSSFVMNIFFILLGSLYSDFAGGRYAVLSSIIFLSIFLRLVQIEKISSLRFIFISLIITSLIVGLIEFKLFNLWIYLLNCV
jgi:hypothetical protein